MVKHFLSLAAPAVGQNILMLLVWQLNVIYVARIGDSTTVAGIGLATATINMLCNSILVGLNGAQETLVSQAYGMKELQLCGRYFNRGLLLLFVFYVPLVVFLFFAEKILVAVGQDPATAEVAGHLVQRFIPAIFLWSVVDLLKRFLTCCNYAFVPLVAMVVGSVLHMLWLWLFVTVFEMGVNGVPMAMVMTESLKLLIIFIYARSLPEMEDALFWPTMDVFTGWGQYLKLSIPTILMLLPEWWAFEFLIIMAGYIGVKDQAVMVVSLNLLGLMWMFPLGFSEAAAAVVGNSMGEN